VDSDGTERLRDVGPGGRSRGSQETASDQTSDTAAMARRSIGSSRNGTCGQGKKSLRKWNGPGSIEDQSKDRADRQPGRGSQGSDEARPPPGRPRPPAAASPREPRGPPRRRSVSPRGTAAVAARLRPATMTIRETVAKRTILSSRRARTSASFSSSQVRTRTPFPEAPDPRRRPVCFVGPDETELVAGRSPRRSP